MPHAQLGDVRLNYRLDGPDDAPVVVLSNSLGTDLTMWAPQMAALSARFRVLRYDSRGHGGSSVPPGPYSIAQMASDVLALLAHVGVAQTHFCGLSMGGMVGLWLAIHAPAHLRRVVLSNTAARIGSPESYDARIAKVRESGMESIADAVLARWFGAPFLAGDPSAARETRRVLVATPPDGYVAACAAVRDMDLRADVGRVSAPTLVIAGTHDLATTTVDARYLVDRIDGARYRELDAAHISNLERPAEFTGALVDFLTEQGVRDG